MPSIRLPAVADLFYPADPDTLRHTVSGFLRADETAVPDHVPKALIVPHAGYRYSGAVAGRGYSCIAANAQAIRRVVLLGPGHRIPFHGLAAPDCDHFRTPLGDIPLDRTALLALQALPQVRFSDALHAEEHSLEVQLPFLQVLLGAFQLIPLVVGEADPEAVAEVLERLWDGAETLVVISSDLSHYHDYDTACRLDAATARAIEQRAPHTIDHHHACGCRAINGLLQLANRRDLQVTTLDLRNSGDAAGGRDRVVGYGTWCLTEPC